MIRQQIGMIVSILLTFLRTMQYDTIRIFGSFPIRFWVRINIRRENVLQILYPKEIDLYHSVPIGLYPIFELLDDHDGKMTLTNEGLFLGSLYE